MRTLRESRVGLTTVALAASGSTTLLFNVVLARRLSVAGFGEVARTYSIALAVAQITMAAVAPAIAWRVARERSDEDRYSRARASLVLLFAAVVCASFCFFVAVLAGLAPSGPVFVAGGWLFTIVYPTYFGLKTILFALDRSRLYARLEFLSDGIFVVFLLAFAVLAPRAGMVTFSIAYGVFVFLAVRFIGRSSSRESAAGLGAGRPLVRYGLLAGAATYSSIVRFPLAVVVAGAVAGATAAGPVAAVIALTMPLFLVPQAAGILTFAGVARSDEEAHLLVRRGVRSVAVATAVFASAAIVLAPHVIPRLLGPRYADTVGPFVVLVACLVPQLIATPIGNALAGEGAVGLSAAVSVAGLIVALAGAAAGAGFDGVDGALFGLGISAVLTGCTLLLVGIRRYALRVRDLVPAFLVVVAIAIEPVSPWATLAVVAAVLIGRAARMPETTRRTLANQAHRWVQPGQAILVVVGASVAVAAGIAFQPLVAAAVAGVIALGLLSQFPARYAVALLLVYLPFEEFVLTHFAGRHTAAVRYAPELAVELLVVVAVLARIGELFPRATRLLAAIAICVIPWVLSALASDNGFSTALIGLRSELRFASLCLVPLLLANPQRDLRFFARVVIWTAGAQSLIAFAEFAGGAQVRTFFAPNWRVELSGVTLAESGPVRLGTVFGTFSNYNGLAIFLLLAWILLASAGGRALGFSRRWGLALGSTFVVAIILSGSREGAAGLVLAALLIGRRRFRLPVVWLVTLVALSAVLFAPLLADVQATAPQGSVSYTSLSKRWRAVASPETWSPTPHGNFRLYLLKSEFDAVRAEAPVFGFGLGSITDPRRVADRSSAAYRTSAGRQAASFRYLFDGNWGLILLETGFAGAAALVGAFILAARFGMVLSERHWVGTALTASVLAFGLIGFFAPVLQLRVPGAVFWLLLGFAVAIHHELRARAPARVDAGRSVLAAA
jgi:O-antigen/teichoic acid export membrane protein